MTLGLAATDWLAGGSGAETRAGVLPFLGGVRPVFMVDDVDEVGWLASDLRGLPLRRTCGVSSPVFSGTVVDRVTLRLILTGDPLGSASTVTLIRHGDFPSGSSASRMTDFDGEQVFVFRGLRGVASLRDLADVGES